MKPIITFAFLLFSGLSVMSQASLVKTFSNAAGSQYTKNISTGAWIVSSMNQDSFYIYDQSFSLITSIGLAGYGTFDPLFASYFSDNLFDSDPGIEYVALVVDTTNSSNKQVAIFESNGSVKQIVATDVFTFGIIPTSSTTYLYVRTDSTLQTKLYSLPGTWNYTPEENDLEQVLAYPNPTSDVFRISTTSPFEQVVLISQDGKIITRNTQITKYGVEVSLEGLSSGIYIYCLTNSRGQSRTGKIIKSD